MGAYDKIFSISVILAVVMIGMGTFLGLYIPSVEASSSVSGSESLVLDKASVQAPMTYVDGDGTLYSPENDASMTVGGVEFSKIIPQELDNNVFALNVTERVDVGTTYGYNWGTTGGGYTFEEAKDLTFVVNVETDVKPDDFYFKVESIIPFDDMDRTIACLNDDTGEIVQKSVGEAHIICYYGNKPYSDAGFRQVVFGMLSFNIPLIPDVIGNLFSGIFLFCMSFVIFAVLLKIAPFTG